MKLKEIINQMKMRNRTHMTLLERKEDRKRRERKHVNLR